MKIIATGITGLVGSRIVELLTPKNFQFINLSLETGVDISKRETIESFFKDNPDSSWVIHLAAKADVEGCEKDKLDDLKLLGRDDLNLKVDEIISKAPQFFGKKTAWAINVIGTLNITELCKKYNKKLIYISTDFVFDGQKNEDEVYNEDDVPNPINFYAQTKYLGEKIIQNLLFDSLICRIAFPYRANFIPKKDLVRGLIEKLKNGEEIKTVEDQFITPTFIDDIVLGLEKLISLNEKRIFHLVGSSTVTPFEATKLIADTFGFDKNLIKKVTREEYYLGRANRPFNLKISNAKIKKLGVTMRTFEEGLTELKKQAENNN